MTPIKQWGVRARVMLVAIVPAIVLALAMITYYTQARLDDLARAYADRGRALAHQIATATEYAVFSGNREDLQRLLTSAFAEDGIRGILVTNASGTPMASSGRLDPPPHVIPSAGDGQRTFSGTIRFHAPIVPVRLNIDGLPGSAPAEPSANVLGTVVLDISTTRLDAQRNELIWTGAAVLALVLAGSIALATRMSQGVSRPIRNVARTVYRIGAGQLHERVDVAGGGSLKRLAIGVNEMAERLQFVRDEMAREIADATAELRARKDAAENADLAKSRDLRRQMTADIAHDLRTPLSLILGHAEALSDGVLPPTPETFDVIHDEARRLNRLVEDLRLLSLAEAGELSFAVRPVQPQSLLERTVVAHTPAAQQKQVELLLDAPADLPDVEVDPDRLAQVLDNLVSNALRYTPENGRIQLTAQQTPTGIQLRVQDSGPGMDAADLAHVFDRFYRGDKSRQRHDGGSGLGLAIARSIVESHNGRIWAESTLGDGATFIIELPLVSL